MKTWARITDGVVVETFTHATNPTPLFDPSWVWVECPADIVQGAIYDGEAFVNPDAPAPVEPEPATPARRLQLSPAEFRNSFSAFEEVAITDFAGGAVEGEDAQTATYRKVVGVFFDRLKDPHLTTVDLADPRNLAGLDLLVGVGVLTQARRDEIATGLPT